MKAIRSKDVPALVFLTSHVAEQLAGPAEELGLTAAGEFPIMVLERPGKLACPEGFHVEPMNNLNRLDDGVSIWSRAYEFPLDKTAEAFGPELLSGLGMTGYVAYKEEEPYSVVLTTQSGSTVGIWAMGTPPEHQRKGSGRAPAFERDQRALRSWSRAILPGGNRGRLSSLRVARFRADLRLEDLGSRRVHSDELRDLLS